MSHSYCSACFAMTTRRSDRLSEEPSICCCWSWCLVDIHRVDFKHHLRSDSVQLHESFVVRKQTRIVFPCHLRVRAVKRIDGCTRFEREAQLSVRNIWVCIWALRVACSSDFLWYKWVIQMIEVIQLILWWSNTTYHTPHFDPRFASSPARFRCHDRS